MMRNMPWVKEHTFMNTRLTIMHMPVASPIAKAETLTKHTVICTVPRPLPLMT